MPVPDDVTVTRQVLAEPDADLAERTWATLATARRSSPAQRRGKGAGRAIPCDRGHALVGSADLRHVRRHAAGGSSRSPALPQAPTAASCRHDRRVPATACSTASAPSPAAGRRRGRSRPIRSRRRFDHPPGFYGPPEGLRRRQHAGAGRPACCRSTSRLECSIDVYRKVEPLDLRGPVMMARARPARAGRHRHAVPGRRDRRR